MTGRQTIIPHLRRERRSILLASRIMHLAIAGRLAAWLPEGIDLQRFLTGSVLVDAAPADQRHATHFTTARDGLRTYDVGLFRARYGHLLQSDGLVLGYYLHLLQDLVFRRFMYHVLRVDPQTPGYLAALYVDYGRLNALLPAQDTFPAPWELPDNACPLEEIADFDLPGLKRALEADLASAGEGEATYLTPERAEMYIRLAVGACRRELRALTNGLPLLDPFNGYTWRRDPIPKEAHK